jgi:hypothetical protein
MYFDLCCIKCSAVTCILTSVALKIAQMVAENMAESACRATLPS